MGAAHKKGEWLMIPETERNKRLGRNPERLLTISQAAKELGIHAWALRRAIKSGTIPAYSPFNGRKLVRLSELVAYIDSCRQGGCK
jgi:excisionase family DNA binding protein